MTTKSKHTPGPWKAETNGLIRQKEADANIFTIGYGAGYHPPREEKAANARLISLAWMLPELVEALEQCAYALPDEEVEMYRHMRRLIDRYHEQEASK